MQHQKVTGTSDLSLAPLSRYTAPINDARLKRRSLARDAFWRLSHNALAVLGLIVIITFVLVALLAPEIAPHDPIRQSSGNSLRAPAWIATANPDKSGIAAHWLGTDLLGRDQWSRLLFGTRVSLLAGLVPTVLTALIGMSIGLIAGFAGGRVDNLLMRGTELVAAFPVFLFLIVLSVSLRDTAIGLVWNGLLLIFVVLAVFSWCDIARLARVQVLLVKRQEFVVAAQTIGASSSQIILRHILPNVVAPVLVSTSFLVPGFILAEAGLSFLGVGMRPSILPGAPFPTSWGVMFVEGYDYMQGRPWMLIPPIGCIGTLSLAFMFVADGLRDALDPQS